MTESILQILNGKLCRLKIKVLRKEVQLRPNKDTRSSKWKR